MPLVEGTPFQIAWVTRDLDATEAELSRQLGARKWFRMPRMQVDPATCVYRGKPVGFELEISLSYVGDTQLEVITPGPGDDNMYEDFLRTSGPGLHHVAIEVDDVEQAVQAATAGGAEVVLAGLVPGMAQVAYVCSPAVTGPSCVEIVHLESAMHEFYGQVKAGQL